MPLTRTYLLSLLLLLCNLSLQAQLETAHHETFDDNQRGWDISDDRLFSAQISDGHYVLSKLFPGSSKSSVEMYVNPEEDYDILMRVRSTKPSSKSGYGLLLHDKRRTPDQWEYSFLIYNDGKAAVNAYSLDLEQKSKLLPKTPLQGSLTSDGGYNELRLEQRNSTLTYYVNDVAQFSSSGEDRPWGVSIGVVIHDLQSLEVDEIILRQDGIKLQSSTDEVSRFAKENLGSGINNEESQLTPRISHDGEVLFYVHEHEYDDSSDQDIYFATRLEDGTWSAGQGIGHPLNNSGSNSLISITPDYNMLLLANHYKDNGSGISYSVRRGDGWSLPDSYTIDQYSNDNRYHNFCLSPNRKVLFMSIERGDGLGELDLHVSFLDEETNSWSAPQNLGGIINTAASDFSPFIAGDGSLYFASEGHPGYGRADIYVSRKLDDSWLAWSEPENLGPGINSEAWDAYFTIPVKGEYAYMVSDGEYGQEDIFRVTVTEATRPEPVILVKGLVRDAKTRAPLKARISYRDLLDDTEIGMAYSDSLTGQYQIILPHGRQYSFHAQQEGYYAISDHVDATALEEFQELERDLSLSPVEVGQVVRLNNIFFALDKSELLPESDAELARLVTLMQENPGLVIAIGGHTDAQGADDYNLNLSQRRVETVMQYLSDAGVQASRYSGKGYGEATPIADNETEEGRALNRRVEFEIVKI